MLAHIGRETLATATQISLGYNDTRRTMVKGLNHLTFIQWHPFAGRTNEQVTADMISTFPVFKFGARAK